MNLQQIEYIVALDKYKSFSKAAEKCFITQATLSTMVKKLEEELDVVIFDRKTTPIITTDAGRMIIAESLQLLNHSNKIKQLSSELQGKVEGELRIGVIPTIAGNLLHRVLPRIIATYPKLKLIIHEINTETIISRLKKGEIDVGIASTPFKNSGLEEDILYYEKLMVYGTTKKSSSKFVSPKDINTDKIWLLEKGNCLSNQVLNVCSLNAKKFSQNIEFNPGTFDSLLNLVDSMDGLTLIPELYVEDLPATRKNKVADFKSPHPVREISLVYHRPFAKLRLIEALGTEIKSAVLPILQTSKLKNRDMQIASIS